MNNIVEQFKEKFEIISYDFPDKLQIAFDVEASRVHSILSYLKSDGYKQLSILTCVDYLEEEKFELVYVLFNWDNGVHIQIRTKLDRNNPKYRSCINIFPGAEYYERDVHEFFGVEFEGNEMSYKHLYLENWDDMPPMRKDFDPQAYSDKKYAKRDYEVLFKSVVEGE
jgi:NADH-quinone oxidoreductase subunit C